MKISVLSEIVSVVCVICVTMAIIQLISKVSESFSEEHIIEYQYKDWSNMDISMAMKYHGVMSATITETEAFFYGKNNKKINLFTNDCIEYIIKEKQKMEEKWHYSKL